MQYFQRFLKNFMPITVIVGIVCTTSSAMAVQCGQNVVGTSTTMLNPEPGFCASVSEIGYGAQSGAPTAEFGVYSCDTCYSSTNLITYTRVQNTIDTSDYGYDCGTVTYYTCNRRISGGSGSTVDECLALCNSGNYCCPHKTTLYSCPDGWEQNLLAHTCSRSDTSSGENNAGYYTISYGSCDATGTTTTTYVVSQSGTITNSDGSSVRCTSCS